MNATLDTTEGYLAYMALRLCAVGKSGFRHEGVFSLGSEHVRRGPRSSTIAAWAAAAGEIKFDDRSLHLGSLLRAVSFAWATRYQRPVFGVIESIEETEATAKITFKRVVEPREFCLSWQETNRVDGINSDGTLRYRQVCKKWGSVMTNVTPKPLYVTTLLARGLKPGMYLIGIEGTPLAFGNGGYAIVATANAKSTKPIWVLGGKVK